MNSGCAGSRPLCRGVNSGTSGSMTVAGLEGRTAALSLESSLTSGAQLVGVVVAGGGELAEGRLLTVGG